MIKIIRYLCYYFFSHNFFEFYSPTNENDQAEESSEKSSAEYGERNNSLNSNALTDDINIDAIESSPMLKRRRESSISQNQQKINLYGISTTV